ncbi:hypothetical protein [Microvirga pudoricolor]|uniref:hypothetical protein n=1 Tax=Microvirga pudoricolor TaxID=2778729 RepID=UPI00194F3542|nr:hypothetical protein [Microvirga pudoricolor]MBM6595270.1 hypothetical protein [Microvirga pudoricolor]
MSILAAFLLGTPFLAAAALADDPNLEPAQRVREAGSASLIATSKRSSGATKAAARKSSTKPDLNGNFIYGLINTIRARSEELCARYGNASDCLEEAEVCLTMRDMDDNMIRLCLNTAPRDARGNGETLQKSRLRR